MDDEFVSADPPVIAVVDDDESVREALPDLLRELGFKVGSVRVSRGVFGWPFHRLFPACLILDVSMPAWSGPELHRELLRQGIVIPTIFITAQCR